MFVSDTLPIAGSIRFGLDPSFMAFYMQYFESCNSALFLISLFYFYLLLCSRLHKRNFKCCKIEKFTKVFIICMAKSIENCQTDSKKNSSWLNGIPEMTMKMSNWIPSEYVTWIGFLYILYFSYASERRVS